MSSRNNNVYFDFKGFRATWKEVTSSGTQAEGAIKSPNFPNDYPNNKDQVSFRKPESIFTLFLIKEWDLSVPAGSKIQLTFNSFDLEEDASCGYDYAQVGLTSNC